MSPFLGWAEGNLRDVITSWRPRKEGGSVEVLNEKPAVDVVPVVEVMPTLFPEAAT
jgi:hypothetical protein